MGSTKLIGKTIGEVEKLTGIPKRKLKYMVERNLMHPSQRSETGFWLYNEADIQTVRSITLLQQLGYPEKDIRTLLVASASQWSENLERQITQLTEKKNHIENQLFFAELLRHQSRIHMDVSAFSPAEAGSPPAWKPGEKDSLCRFLYQIFSEVEFETPLHELSLLAGQSPDDPVIQEQIQRLCDLFWQRKALSPAQLLLILRLAHTLSGLIPVLDALLCAEGAVEFITTAMQYYCDHQKRASALLQQMKENENEDV